MKSIEAEQSSLNQDLISALQKITNALVIADDLNSLLDMLVEEATGLLKGSGGVLYLVDESIDKNIISAAVGTAKSVKGLETSLSSSLSGWVTLNKTPVLCRSDDPRIDTNIAKRIGFDTVIAAPLIFEDKIIGSLEIMDKKKGTTEFNQSEINLLQIFASNATIAINKMRSDEKMRRQSERLHVINYILSESSSSTNIDELLRNTALQIHRSFRYKSYIGVIEQGRLVFKIIFPDDTSKFDSPVVLPLNEGVTGAVAASAKPIIVMDVTREPRYYQFSKKTRSELVVPLLTSEGTSIGVLNVESNEIGAFSNEDLQIFQTIAASITLAIENARAQKILTALHKISTAVIQAQDLDQILDNIVETAVELLNASASTLYLPDPDSRSLTLFRHIGLPDSVVERVRKLDWGQSIAGKVLQTGKPIFVEDMATDIRADGTFKPEDGLHSLIDVPIKTNEHILGVLAVLTKETRAFTEHDVSTLEAIGNNIGVAIEKSSVKS